MRGGLVVIFLIFLEQMMKVPLAKHELKPKVGDGMKG
jgi:hypothetical protein